MKSKMLGLCVLLVISCFHGTLSEPVNSRIVGGLSAKNMNTPYMASVQKYGQHKCGGSIINPRTLLTAASCVDNERPSALRVHIGSKTTSLDKGQLFSVDAIHKHESYRSSGLDYDIGLIRLSRAIRYNTDIQPIRLPAKNEKIIDGLWGMIFGWGVSNSKDSKGSDMLQYALVPVRNQVACDRLIGSLTEVGHLTERMFCAGYLEGGIDACKLDAGGPFVSQDKLIGIISWGDGCAKPNKPGVYVRVSAFVPWVKNILRTKYRETLN